MVVTEDNWLEADRRVFNSKKEYIQGALRGDTGIIDGVTEENKENIFYMLMFCLCVPQSRAIKAEEAIQKLRSMKFYSETISLEDVVKTMLKLVRFHTVKSERLVEAKNKFSSVLWDTLKQKYTLYKESKNLKEREQVLLGVRQFLIKNVKGLGMKTSSHFLRNIGMGGLAILDIHVIDGLRKRGMIDIEKLSQLQEEYLGIEQIMKGYADLVGISIDELDLLLWSQKTGYVFK